MKLQFSDLLFFSALYLGIVLGSTVTAVLDDTKLNSTKKIETSTTSSNLLKENVAAAGNDSDLTIILPDTNNTSQTNVKTNIKVAEKNVSNISETLSVKQNENKTNKISLMPALPTAAPELGKWIIRDSTTNKTCIVAQMIMQLNITYPGLDDKVLNATINGPGKNSTVNGSCSESPESMFISWSPNHSLKINFEKNSTANDYYISSISVNISATALPNVKENVTSLPYNTNFTKLFDTPLDMSYKCGKKQTVNLTSENPQFHAVLTVQDTQFQAYMNNSKSDFGIAQDCETFDTPDMVPIVVGTALAVLVVVVLISYIVARRQSQNRGYLSM